MNIRLLLIIAFTMALTACGTTGSLSKSLANRAACTADGKEVLIASMYGPVGIVSKLDVDDAKAILDKGCGSVTK